LELAIELLTSKKQQNQILAVFHIKNLTDSSVEKAQFVFEPSDNFKLLPHPSRQPTDPIPLAVLPTPNSTVQLRVPFVYSSFSEPQSVNSSFEYSSGKLDFTINFPISASIQPEDITPEAFIDVLVSQASQTRTIESVNTTLQKAIPKLGGNLHLKLVSRDEDKVSLYGRTVTGSHLGVLVQKNDNENIAIAFKSDSGDLLDHLIKEVEAFHW